MIQITEEMIAAAEAKIATGTPEAVGYRLMVKPLQVTTEMSDTLKEKYPTLAGAVGTDGKKFEDKTAQETQRQNKGTNYALVANLGEHCFKTAILGGKNWVEEGEIAIIDRYAGAEIEIPYGSKNMYRFTNDESILGRVL